MPYIKQEDRDRFFEQDQLSKDNTAGELNFCISSLCREYIKAKGKSYAVLNEVVGALECAKLELYRRVAAPYEDEKIIENGDVYE